MIDALKRVILSERRRLWLDPDDAQEIAEDIAAHLAEAPAKTAERPKKHISLGFMSQGDSRQPRTMRLMVQSEDFLVETMVDLSEHDFAALLSGQSIKVECEI